MGKLPKGTEVKHVEKFAFNLRSADTLKCCGVQTVNGALRSGVGFAELKKSKSYKGIVGVSGKYAYAYSENAVTIFNGESFSETLVFEKPCAFVRGAAYRDSMFTSIESNGFWTHRGRQNQQVGYEIYDDIAVVGERLVGLKGGVQLWFDESGTMGIFPYGKAQRFNLQTECQALARLGYDCLYALGSTCYKVEFAAEPTNIRVSIVAQELGKVLPNTVKTVRNCVVFATSDGLYIIKNNKVSRFFTELDNVIGDYSLCIGSVFGDKYVLSVPTNKGRVAYVLDMDSKTCNYIMSQNVSSVISHGENAYALFADGTIKKMSNEIAPEACYVRSNIDFDTGSRKYLRRLKIKTAGDVDVYITGENETRLWRIKGKKAFQNIPVTGVGSCFTLELRSNNGIDVSALELTAEIYKEVI